MNWTDWIGIALLAYGVVAGWIRGLVHQSTRLGAIILALVLASLSHWPSQWVARQFEFNPEQDPSVMYILDIGIFVLAVLALTLVRGLVFMWVEGPKNPASRWAGATIGAVSSVIVYLVFLSGVTWMDEPGQIRGARGYELAWRAMRALDKVPSPPRPAFLQAAQFPAPDGPSGARHTAPPPPTGSNASPTGQAGSTRSGGY